MHSASVKCLKHKARLTGASVVAFWVPHAKVSHGAGGEAHAYLTDVIALQEDEKLGLTFNAAVILRASVTAFRARWWPLSTNCGKINREKGRVRLTEPHGAASHKRSILSSQILTLLIK